MSKRKPTLRTTVKIPAKIKIVKPKMSPKLVTYRMTKPPHWVLATDGAGFYVVLADDGAIGIIPATMAYDLMKSDTNSASLSASL